MVFGCANNIIKLMVFGLNFIICAGGAIILAISLVALFSPDSIVNLTKDPAFDQGTDFKELADFLTNSEYRVSLWVLVAVGGFLFLVGFLGCAGAACENVCMLGLFFVILLVIMLVQLAGTVYFLVNKDDFRDKVEGVLVKMEKEGKEPFTKAFEEKMKCCGVAGATDGHKCDPYIPEANRKTGCWASVYDDLKSTGVWAIVVSFFVIACEGLALLFSCVLFKAFNERRDYYS